jgi:hypothetical protein
LFIAHESLETMQINKCDGNRDEERSGKVRPTAAICKHNSAPLMEHEVGSQPLNDISNKCRIKQLNNSSSMASTATTACCSNNNNSDFDSVTDLENLFFGNEPESGAVAADQDYIIKQSLEIDATCKNLIGDRSKQHILPVIPSAKHTDLHCISPQTVTINTYILISIKMSMTVLATR